MFYSKTTNGFYDPEINITIPADAVEITSDEHAALMAAQATGKVIESDSNSYPIAVTTTPVPVPLPDQARAALDVVTGSRGQIIRCVAAGVAVPIEWTDYVFALRSIANGTDATSTNLPVTPAFVPNT